MVSQLLLGNPYVGLAWHIGEFPTMISQLAVVVGYQSLIHASHKPETAMCVLHSIMRRSLHDHSTLEAGVAIELTPVPALTKSCIPPEESSIR